jgi:pyruvate/2-oxoglutarate dehydrogenase complex dihydrolipoamide dehydrogenase (E3) component
VLPDLLVTGHANADLIIDEVINRVDNKIYLKSGQEIQYDRLVLATGSNPINPQISGTKKRGVFLVEKNIEYLSELRSYSENSQYVVIIGGGYIGVELADEFVKAGKNVTIVENRDHLLSTSMDPEFGNKTKDILTGLGVTVMLGQQVKEILGGEKVSSVKLSSGKQIIADMVILCIGSQPNTQLADTFGLKYDKHYGIFVDEYLRSSEKNIFVVGDAAAKQDFFTGTYTDVRLASTAMAEGRLVGSNLFEIKVIRKYIGVLGSFSTKIGGTAFGVCGLTESKAKAMNLDYTIGETITADRHPAELNGASKIHLKLIFARYSHVLLGAEMHGGDSVGELVNMFSVMILNKMTDMDIDNLQIGTHPLLTPSPLAYPAINATVNAIQKWYNYDA